MDHLTSFFPAGRNRGVTVAIEGFFAFAWFGWGQAAARSWLVAPLAVGDGPGGRARNRDSPVDGYWRRSGVVPARVRPGHAA